LGIDAEYWPLVMARRRFLDLTGAAVPIVQAPMAGASGPALAIAALRAGAVGSLPCALLTPDQLRQQVAEVRGAVSGPLNVNFFAHRLIDAPDEAAWREALTPYYAEEAVGPPETPLPLRAPFDAAMCAAVEDVRPEIISFHFGLPEADLLQRVRATGALVIGNATTVAEARWLAGHGVDAIIAQGSEAGGHAGHFLAGHHPVGTMALVPQVVDAVDVPVIAAGGIGDARGIAASMLLGADAVQLGTAYLHTPESLVSATHRARLAGPEAEDTVFTNLFTGGLARGMRNRLINELGPVNPVAPPFPYASNALAELRRVSEADYASFWAGQAAPLGRPEPAQTLTERLAREAYALVGEKVMA
jgi:nitronate monooxygenase